MSNISNFSYLPGYLSTISLYIHRGPAYTYLSSLFILRPLIFWFLFSYNLFDFVRYYLPSALATQMLCAAQIASQQQQQQQQQQHQQQQQQQQQNTM